MSSVDSAEIYEHPVGGTFPRLTNSNYAAWKGSTYRVLRVIRAWTIVDGTESMPPLAPPGATPAEAAAAEHKRRDYIQRRRLAAAVIYNACSIGVCAYIVNIDDPKDMWSTLGKQCNPASTKSGRQSLLIKFQSTKPIPGAPISDFICTLLSIRNQLVGSEEAISDATLRCQIFVSLPPEFEIIVKALRIEAVVDINKIIRALKDDEMLRETPTTDVYYSSSNHGSRQRYDRGRGNPRGGFHNNKENRWCTHCWSSTHNTNKCYYKPESNNKRHRETSEDDFCHHCSKSGHNYQNCRIRRRGEAARERAKRDIISNGPGKKNQTSVAKGASDSSGY